MYFMKKVFSCDLLNITTTSFEFMNNLNLIKWSYAIYVIANNQRNFIFLFYFLNVLFLL